MTDFKLPDVRWYPCKTCGEETTSRNGVCFECTKAKAQNVAQTERLAAARRSMGDNFVDIDVDELRSRIHRDVDVDAALGASRDFRNLTFWGVSGTAKTTLACWLMERWVKHNKAAASFVSAYRLSGHTFDLDNEWVRAPLLVIDDLGNERQVANSLTKELVDHRYASKLCTWVTTGMTPKMLGKLYGDSVARRVFDFRNSLRIVPVGPAPVDQEET